MKTLKLYLIPAFGILSFVTMSHIVTSNGSPGGKSGSPGDLSKTCTDCHGGGKATDKPGWITTDIPEAGYRHDTVYSITGQQLISLPVELSTGTDRISLDVSKLPNGAYFVVLSSATRITKSKLLIIR